MRDIFSTARDLAPSIVFIDEIDSIGTKRYDADSSGAREVQRKIKLPLPDAESKRRIFNIHTVGASACGEG